MPYKTDSKKLGDNCIRRNAKLLDCQKEMIVYWHKMGESQRKIAAMFHVSRRLIQFIVDPKKQEENMKRRAERGGTKQYYDKEKNREYTKNHRKYKYKILKDIL